MADTMLLTFAMATLCALSVSVTVVLHRYLAIRGTRLVTCPETLATAAVDVDAAYATWTDVIGGMELRLRQCSRWPERGDCGQECLRTIEDAPEDCLVRTILARWYAEQRCALCHKPFAGIRPALDKPGLLTADGTPIEWTQVRPDDLPRVLTESRALCWNCETATEFRRRFPALVVDQSPYESAISETHRMTA